MSRKSEAWNRVDVMRVQVTISFASLPVVVKKIIYSDVARIGKKRKLGLLGWCVLLCGDIDILRRLNRVTGIICDSNNSSFTTFRGTAVQLCPWEDLARSAIRKRQDGISPSSRSRVRELCAINIVLCFIILSCTGRQMSSPSRRNARSNRPNITKSSGGN